MDPYEIPECPMHALMRKRVAERQRLEDAGDYEKARMVRIYPDCVPCRGRYDCDYFDEFATKLAIFHGGNNGGNGSQKPAVIMPGEVERIIAEAAPEPMLELMPPRGDGGA
jgi:hypothetical protein